MKSAQTQLLSMLVGLICGLSWIGVALGVVGLTRLATPSVGGVALGFLMLLVAPIAVTQAVDLVRNLLGRRGGGAATDSVMPYRAAEALTILSPLSGLYLAYCTNESSGAWRTTVARSNTAYAFVVRAVFR